jgi:YggT family protein
MSGFITVGYFLTALVFDLLLFTLWTRVALRYLRISSLNPFSRLIFTLTNRVINPLHFILRHKDQAKQKYDWTALIVIVLAECLKISLLSLLAYNRLMPVTLIVLYVVSDFIIQPCNFLFYAILIRVIMSYVNPYWQHPVADFLRLLTEPLLVLGRKIIPDISGFDFSPFIMMIILQIVSLFIRGSLPLHIL